MRLPRPLLSLAVVAAMIATTVPTGAAEAVFDPQPGRQCRAAIAAAERGFAIPAGMLAAIGRVESGRRTADGSVDPWPWSIDADGIGSVLASKPAAIEAVRALQARDVRSIDVGCLQVNLLQHPDAFASLEQAFDPAANASFAARFLVQLHAQTGDWPAAAALYHSATPALAAEYRRKVMAAWPAELAAASGSGGFVQPMAMRRSGGTGLTPGGAPVAQILPRSVSGGRMLPPLAAGQGGRDLATYRALPIPLARSAPGFRG